MMKKISSLFLLVLVTGCCMRTPCSMNRETYVCVFLGSTTEELTQCAGCPYRVYRDCSGETVWEYIEHISLAGEPYRNYHYYITIRDEKVVSKRTCCERPYYFDLIYQENPNELVYPYTRP